LVAVLICGQLVEQVVENLHWHLLLGLAVPAVPEWLLDFLDLAVLFLVGAGEGRLQRVHLVELLHQLLQSRRVRLLESVLQRLALVVIWDVELGLDVLLQLIQPLSLVIVDRHLAHLRRWLLSFFFFVLRGHGQLLVALLAHDIGGQLHLGASVYLLVAVFLVSGEGCLVRVVILVPGGLELLRHWPVLDSHWL
jgi:hypothetical protein